MLPNKNKGVLVRNQEPIHQIIHRVRTVPEVRANAVIVKDWMWLYSAMFVEIGAGLFKLAYSHGIEVSYWNFDKTSASLFPAIATTSQLQEWTMTDKKNLRQHLEHVFVTVISKMKIIYPEFNLVTWHRVVKVTKSNISEVRFWCWII